MKKVSVCQPCMGWVFFCARRQKGASRNAKSSRISEYNVLLLFLIQETDENPIFGFQTPSMPGTVPHYKIVPPAIASAGVYFFTTDSGLLYEVRFGRRQDNILHATIVFGVINEEFDGEEYVVTNRGEVFRVMTTIVMIVKMFMEEHQKIMCYEFTGIPKDDEDDEAEGGKSSQRTLLYKRYLPRIFETGWDFNFSGNSAVVTKKNRF